MKIHASASGSRSGGIPPSLLGAADLLRDEVVHLAHVPADVALDLRVAARLRERLDPQVRRQHADASQPERRLAGRADDVVLAHRRELRVERGPQLRATPRRGRRSRGRASRRNGGRGSARRRPPRGRSRPSSRRCSWSGRRRRAPPRRSPAGAPRRAGASPVALTRPRRRAGSRAAAVTLVRPDERGGDDGAREGDQRRHDERGREAVHERVGRRACPPAACAMIAPISAIPIDPPTWRHALRTAEPTPDFSTGNGADRRGRARRHRQRHADAAE